MLFNYNLNKSLIIKHLTECCKCCSCCTHFHLTFSCFFTLLRQTYIDVPLFDRHGCSSWSQPTSVNIINPHIRPLGFLLTRSEPSGFSFIVMRASSLLDVPVLCLILHLDLMIQSLSLFVTLWLFTTQSSGIIHYTRTLRVIRNFSSLSCSKLSEIILDV